MKFWTFPRAKSIPVIALFSITLQPHLPAQEADRPLPVVENADALTEEEMNTLAKAAVNFVDAYNRADAPALAAFFTPLGEIIGSDGEILSGRQAIRDHYQATFDQATAALMALEASEVRLVAPGAAMESGLFHLTGADDEPVRSFRYVVTHARQPDGSWLIGNSRILSEIITPSEQIKPLHWLIGEWTLEVGQGVRMDMVMDLDARENHLIGESLITDAEGGAQSTSLRIGWNPATASVYWWTFDSEGGNSSGPWMRNGMDWLVQTQGVTADGETSAASQILTRDGDAMVWSMTHRMLAGEALPDLTYRFVRRAPDPISLLTPESANDGE
jgi:uncharacterized protein (TIGR02246 family)